MRLNHCQSNATFYTGCCKSSLSFIRVFLLFNAKSEMVTFSLDSPRVRGCQPTTTSSQVVHVVDLITSVPHGRVLLTLAPVRLPLQVTLQLLVFSHLFLEHLAGRVGLLADKRSEGAAIQRRLLLLKLLLLDSVLFFLLVELLPFEEVEAARLPIHMLLLLVLLLRVNAEA